MLMTVYIAIPFYILAFTINLNNKNINDISYSKYIYTTPVVQKRNIYKITREEEIKDIEALSNFMNGYKYNFTN